MSAFDNVLRGANDRLAFDPDRKPLDPLATMKMSISGKPRSTVDLSVEKVLQNAWDKEGKKDESKPAEKTTTKMKICHGDCTTTWTYSNEKFAMQGVGKLLNSDGWKANLDGTLESKYLKNVWKGVLKVDAATPDLGGARLNASVEVERESTGAQKVKPKVNALVSDEVNVGLSGTHDSKELTNGLFQAVYAPTAGGLYWLRSDLITKDLSAGCDTKWDDITNQTWEASYNWGGAEGLRGTNLTLRHGGDYKPSGSTSVTWAGSWGKDVQFIQNTGWKLDKNWSVSSQQRFHSGKLGTPQGAYHVGFGVTYKL